MDNATREALLNLLRNLRDTVDEQFHINEMAWRTYSALIQMFPEFAQHYQRANEHVSFDQMLCTGVPSSFGSLTQQFS